MAPPVIGQLLLMSVWLTLGQSAFINMASKPVHCARPAGNLTHVSIHQLKSSMLYPVGEKLNSLTNRTLILDKHVPSERIIVVIFLHQVSTKLAIVTVSCESIGTATYCRHFMLAEPRVGRTIWLKQLADDEQHFYGFHRGGWRRAFLYHDPTEPDHLLLQACNYYPLRLTTKKPKLRLIKCSNWDTDRRHRTNRCDSPDMFAGLIRKVQNGRVSYVDEGTRMVMVTLAFAGGCIWVTFLVLVELLKRLVK